ncbi:hypothetical protein NJ76_01635, partial [Rhodococcus sp. IITR03]
RPQTRARTGARRDVYDPELVVIGGGVSGSAPLFLDAAREHYAAVTTGAGHRPLARVRVAQLGDAAGSSAPPISPDPRSKPHDHRCSRISL